MTKTKYYDLQMDDPQDDYDVEVVNANLKKIDEQMKTRENATDALQEPEFTVADKRENIASKEKMQKILGKIAKFFTDLKTVAFTGSYKDLSNKPTSLPASDVSAWAKANTKPTYTKAEVGLGNVDNTADANKSVKYATSAGNATKVNNYTVNANVPSGAKFTDTTYGVATTTKTGIVKPDGKTITADKDGTLHGADTIKVDGITITRDDATKVIALAKTLQDKIGTIGNKVDKNYVVNNLTTTKQGFVLDGRQGKALQDQITSLNGSLENYITFRHGYFGTSGATGSWMQSSDYQQMYQYGYSFPDVDGYKFLVGFTNIAWTNNNKYFDYMLRNYILSTQSGNVEMYSEQGTPDCVMYFFGLYIKS